MYDPTHHHRRSIRLNGYDYAQAGFYFITLCCQDRARLFGQIIDGKMILNDAGKIIEKWYYEIAHKFPDKKCHAMVIMPDHFHCIVETIAPAEQPLENEHANCDEPAGSSQRGSPVGRVVQWFKTMSTNEYIRGVKNLGWTPFNGRLWQRNYYEHIIRNRASYERISKYIIDNPKKWQG
ncbi:MAG: transposase [Niabella sp.]|nr:transposase [Niabella sp.]